MTLRSPIITVLGHVDHGKTTLLDKIRGTVIAKKEAGAITQHVGASFIPTSTIKEKCKSILEKLDIELTIPGLLIIDTPGHEAFTNLRKRGGSIADLAVVVIDVNQGIQPQTEESIEILKINKVPFAIAANKIDLINGWEAHENATAIETIRKQREFVQEELDEKIYKIIGQLAEFGINSERFDRVRDKTKEVVIIPLSAKTGEGIQELLLTIAGLAQKYMLKKLDINEEKKAKGAVLEVKETTGLGTTIDAIIYEGKITQGDTIVLAGKKGVFKTKIRALLQPAPLEEIRDTGKKFKSVKEVHAAAGLKISAPGLEEAMAGSPLIATDKPEEAMEEVKKEIEKIEIETSEEGVIIKTDALGSLEAIEQLFKKGNIPIKKAEVGVVNKKDLTEAETIKRQNRYYGTIFAFNTKVPEEIREEANKKEIAIFESDVIYQLEEDYKKWKEEEEKKEKEEQLNEHIYPAKIKILPGHLFRASKPAVVGVQILEGIIKSNYPLINEKGKPIGKIKSIQKEKQKVEKAEKGGKVAISIEGGIVGKNIQENQVLFTDVPREQLYDTSKEIGDKELIKEIKSIKKAREE